MAVRHRLLKANPNDVRAVLADGNKYPQWVVGPSAVEPLGGQRPRPGPALRYQVRLGRLRLSDETVIRRCEEGPGLELKAHTGHAEKTGAARGIGAALAREAARRGAWRRPPAARRCASRPRRARDEMGTS
ncbi:SRPBCC family protein [Streptomyces sp. NEAU-YJ-81]|uniref:SRPBCC family protein n=1 Tax=Streptomyces sp. NEAU-YJ-81 TaxID=2820288 RepID=UPI001ABC89F8|nr:SRPBCC family protein [Streptomyces sp. NEAU-YJ-81]MBO3678662.1 SRPBCC family protein [Streptomyces sp. NEAU-YJ-81]